MNGNRAREHFSAVYEGSLDAHQLKQFEAELAKNPALQREWDQFVSSIEDLESLRAETVPVPDDLNERIMMRLDRSIWETKNAPATRSWLGTWWRSLAMGGAAATILIATFLSLNKRSNDFSAGLSLKDEPLSVRAKGKDVEIVSMPSADTNLIVRDAQSSEILATVPVHKPRTLSPLHSSDAEGRIVSINLGGSDRTILVALPAAKPSTGTSGTVAELAIAVATARGQSVVVEAVDLSAKVTWKGDLKKNLVDADPLRVQLESRRGLLYLVTD